MCKDPEIGERECGIGEEYESSGNIREVSVLPREGTYFMPCIGQIHSVIFHLTFLIALEGRVTFLSADGKIEALCL